MEFYFGFHLPSHPYKMFQFPTGWNSTTIFMAPIPINLSFNSQRDGILPIRPKRRRNRGWFQFPTGWNSTDRFGLDLSTPFCFNSQRDGILLTPPLLLFFLCRRFNSQRDGILLCEVFWFRIRWLVSIPNGMEFYREVDETPRQSKVFQFPTGWNST